MIMGAGTAFRFVTFYARDFDYGGNDCNYTFLLHKRSVLVRGMYEQNYSMLEDGSLLMWKTTDWYKDPKEILGRMFPADHPMVVGLQKALLEDAEQTMLGANDEKDIN